MDQEELVRRLAWRNFWINAMATGVMTGIWALCLMLITRPL